ncbi:hypothetical protein ACFLXU_01345 [Chloroflexota bacterium]
MGILALVFGILGGLCAVMGIITAAEVIPLLGAEFTAMFWLTLGAVLLLACIASVLSRTSYD